LELAGRCLHIVLYLAGGLCDVVGDWFCRHYIMFLCEYHTKQAAEPGFVSVSWLPQAVQHRCSAGVQSIAGFAEGWHSFHFGVGRKVPSHCTLSPGWSVGCVSGLSFSQKY
jgi:hypothetical protein